MDELRYQVDLLNAMNHRMQADERMYRLICDSSSNAFIYFDVRNKIVRTLGQWDSFFEDVTLNDINDLSKLYSYIEEESVLDFKDMIFWEDKEEARATKIFKFSGKNRYFECEVNVLYEDDNITDKIIRFKDVTKVKNQNDELTYMAYFDILTGLYNRNYFVRLLADYVRKAEEENASISVMFIDLDDFHSINDGMGIVIGDEIVQQFGFLLKNIITDNVIISRFNADVYCIAIYDPNPNQSPNSIFDDIQNKIKTPIKLSNGNEVVLSFCMGVAEYPEASTNALELINCAEIVMFKAKKKGRGQIQYFDAPILRDFLNNVNIENKLKEAVFNQNFQMNFQPQYYSNTRKLRGVEALIRWRDYDGKYIPPSLFIPLAEKNGTIIPIGSWIVEESIRQYSQWKAKYGIDFKLSLNISAIQYRSDTFVDDVLSIIKKYDILPENIELEITESVFIDDFNDVVEKLHLLREFGIMISLDDFGTGYSSLSYLKGLPIDTIKIDKSFVDTVTTDENARVILDTIIYMSKKLGYEIIAEGVEMQSQFDYLLGTGCDCIQGYFFSKPLDQGGMERLLLSLQGDM